MANKGKWRRGRMYDSDGNPTEDKPVPQQVTTAWRRQAQEEQKRQREVDRRVVDALSAAGVRESLIQAEVLFFLPTEFVRAYEKLFNSIFQAQTAQSLRTGDEGGGSSKGRTYMGRWAVKDADKLKFKQRIDMALRRIAEEIEGGGGVMHRAKCRECKRELTTREMGPGICSRCDPQAQKRGQIGEIIIE